MFDNSPFLRWWLIFVSLCLGSIAAYYFDLFQLVHESDFTKISFLIYFLFVCYTFFIGSVTKRASKASGKLELDKLCRKNEQGWFVADALLTLGMIGTVVGFIYMLGTSFANMSADNVKSLQEALSSMGAGMSTALYTTAAGLVCSLALKLQLFNLSQHLNAAQEKPCDCNDDPCESE
jgi:hypothetical protein